MDPGSEPFRLIGQSRAELQQTLSKIGVPDRALNMRSSQIWHWVYHRGAWTSFTVWEMQELGPGNRVEGPAIIRDPMTTVVVPPGKAIELDAYRILHYRTHGDRSP